MLIYFARDIGRIIKAWFSGLFVTAHRDADYWMGWWVIIGTIPIGVARAARSSTKSVMTSAICGSSRPR